MCEFNTATKASQWLLQGNLLAYPTESVWGLGCDAMNQQAVNQLLTIKQRHVEKGLIVLTDSIERIEPFFTSLNHTQQQKIIDSWTMDNDQQQATTWLFDIPSELCIPSWITGVHDKIAIRVIQHPLIKHICKRLVNADNPYGFLVSTSCNLATLPPAITQEQAQLYFTNCKKIGYLKANTLEYKSPSNIKDSITLQTIR